MMNYFTEVYETDRPLLVAGRAECHYEIFQKAPFVSQTNAFEQLDFRYEVAFRSARVPEVKAVFTSAYGENSPFFFVWIVVPKRDERVYKEIFRVEKSLIDDFGPVRFDFTIMPAGEKKPRQMVTDPTAKLIYIRDEG